MPLWSDLKAAEVAGMTTVISSGLWSSLQVVSVKSCVCSRVAFVGLFVFMTINIILHSKAVMLKAVEILQAHIKGKAVR